MCDPFTKPVVVIDNGSYNIKAGFASDNHPVSIFRTTVGRPKFLQGTYGKTPYDVYVGDEAVARLDVLDLNYPVVKGKITHWDDMERVWHHIFYRELKAAPEDRAVLLSCAPATTMEDKVKCCEVFFEALNAPALCVKPQSFLALFGSGHTTGLSVDLGEDVTGINPIYEGGSITYANMVTGFAGNEIKNWMKQRLETRGIDLGTSQESEAVINNLWNYLYVNENCSATKEKYKKEYKLPNGQYIDVSDEVFMAGEMYFQPDLVLGKKTDAIPLQEAVVTSILKVDKELHSEMYEGIVTHGGLLTIPGFNKRLASEIERIIHRPVYLRETSESYACAWMGGSVFAGMKDAPKIWVYKKQFEEYGAKVVRNKFL